MPAERFQHGDYAHEAITVPPRPSWHAQAACRGLGPAAWFPVRGQPVEAAQAVCARCPVRAECLAAALDRGETHGVWGGLAIDARLRLRRAAS